MGLSKQTENMVNICPDFFFDVDAYDKDHDEYALKISEACNCTKIEALEALEEFLTWLRNEQKEYVARREANKPRCPTCSSTNLKKIPATSKVANTVAFGIFGTKRFKTFHCNNCGYEW